MTRLNMNKDESQNNVQEPSQLINSLSKLYTLLRTNQFGLIQRQGIEDLQTEVIDCLQQISTSLKSSFNGCTTQNDIFAAKQLMTEEGALFNLAQVFNYVLTPRSTQGISIQNKCWITWSEKEVQVMILCFNLFAYVDKRDLSDYGIIVRVFELIRKGINLLEYPKKLIAGQSEQEQQQPPQLAEMQE